MAYTASRNYAQEILDLIAAKGDPAQVQALLNERLEKQQSMDTGYSTYDDVYRSAMDYLASRNYTPQASANVNYAEIANQILTSQQSSGASDDMTHRSWADLGTVLDARENKLATGDYDEWRDSTIVEGGLAYNGAGSLYEQLVGYSDYTGSLTDEQVASVLASMGYTTLPSFQFARTEMGAAGEPMGARPEQTQQVQTYTQTVRPAQTAAAAINKKALLQKGKNNNNVQMVALGETSPIAGAITTPIAQDMRQRGTIQTPTEPTYVVDKEAWNEEMQKLNAQAEAVQQKMANLYHEVQLTAPAGGSGLTNGKAVLDAVRERLAQEQAILGKIEEKKQDIADRARDNKFGSDLNRDLMEVTLMEEGIVGDRMQSGWDTDAAAMDAQRAMQEQLLRAAYDQYYDQETMEQQYEAEKNALYAEWQQLNSRELQTGVYGDRTAGDVWADIERLEDDYQTYLVEAESYWAQRELEKLSTKERLLVEEYAKANRNTGTEVQGEYESLARKTALWDEMVTTFGSKRARVLAQLGERAYDAKEQAAENEALREYAKSGVVQATLASAASIVTNFVSAPGALVEIVRQKLNNPARLSTLNTNAPGFDAQNATRSIRGGVQELIMPDADKATFGQKAGVMLYSTIMSGIDSALAGKLLKGIEVVIGGEKVVSAAGLLLGATTATNTAQDITERGGTINQAVTGGLAAGAFEMIFEDISLGKLDALKETESVRTVKDYLLNTAKSMGVNASEEAATELANILFDIAAMGNVSDYQMQLRELMLENPKMSEAEAKRELAGALALRVVESGISGALMGAAFGVWGSAVAAQNTKAKDTFANTYFLPGLIDQALSYPGTAAFDMAADLQVKRNEGVTIPYEEVSALTELVQREVETRRAQGAGIAEATNAEATEVMLGVPEIVQAVEQVIAQQQAVQTEIPQTEQQTEQQAERKQTAPEETVQNEVVPTAQEAERAETEAGNIPARVETENAVQVNAAENALQQDAAETVRQLAGVYQGQDLAEAVQDTANTMRMAGETALAEEIETVAAQSGTVARQTSEEYTGITNNVGGAEYGGEESGVRVRDSGERNDGAYPGGQAGAVAEGTGRNSSGDLQTVAGGRGGNGVAAAGDQASYRTRKGSTRSLFGFPNGSVKDTVGIYEELSPEMEDARQQAAQNGYTLRFADGLMHFRTKSGEFEADGVYQNGEIVVNANAQGVDYLKLANHEMFHGFAEENEGLVDAMVLQVFGDLSDSEIRDMIIKYRVAYMGSGYTDAQVLEEICADAYAGMDRENLGLAARTESARAFVERATDMQEIRRGGSRETRAGPARTKNAPAEARAERYSASNGEKYTYDALVSKPDMRVTVVDDTDKVSPGKEQRKAVVDDAIENSASVGYTNKNGNAVVPVDDIGIDVIVSKKGLTHGMDRRFSTSAPVLKRVGEVLRNAVCVNELIPRSRDVSETYVLIGVAENENKEKYITSFVVNRHTHELETVNVLYSANIKKESAALLPKITGFPATPTDSKISIADVLDYVNKFFPDILSMDVLSHFGKTTRPIGELGKNARFSAAEPTAADLLERERELDERIAMLEIEADSSEAARVQLTDARLERAAVREKRQEMEPIRETPKTEAQKPAEPARKIFRPTETIRKTENRILDLFHVQAGSRAEMRGQLDTLLNRILLDGYVGESNVNAVLRMMYDTGIEVMPADPAYEGIAESLRGRHIYVSPEVRAEFGDDWNSVRQALWGRRIYTSQNEQDVGVDSVYAELAEEYPGLFDEAGVDTKEKLEELLEAATLGRNVHLSLQEAAKARGLDSEAEFAHMVDVVSQELAKFADVSKLESRMRDRTADELAKQRAYYTEQRKKASERRAVTEEMNKIRNALKRLQKRAKVNDTTLTRVLADQDEAVRIVAEKAMAQISTVANRITGRKMENLLELQQAYMEAAKSENFVPNPATEKVLKRVGEIHLNEMSVEDLHVLRDAVERIEHDLKTANEMIGDAWYEQVDEAGRGLVREIQFAKGASGGGLIGAVYNEESLSPSRALLRYVGYDRSGVMGKLVKDFEDGDLRAMEYALGTDEIFFPFQRDKKNQEWLRTASGKKAETVTVEIPRIFGWNEGDQPIFEDGKPNTMTIELTQMMLVQMALDLQNEDNLRHIKYGGYSLPVISELKRGKTKQAYIKARPDAMKGVKLGPDTMRSIVEKYLAPEGKEYAKLLHRYYNGFSKERINRTSRMLDGVDKAITKNYYPIRSDDSYLKREFNVFDGTLEGMGSLKTRESYADNPITLGEAHNTLQWHRDNMARYYAYAVPKRNFEAVLNKHAGEGNVTVKSVFGEKWGKNAIDFMDNFVRMVETERIEDGQDILSKLTGNYVRGVLNYNVWSALKQLGAVPTAATSLGPGSMAAGLLPQKVNMELVRKYTPYLEYRNKGYTYQELAEYVERGVGTGSKVWQTLTGQNWLNGMDTFVNKRMWAAAEHWVQNHTNLRPSGNQELIDAGLDPYYKKVAEVFNRATHDTQTNYNMMSRPFILHRKGMKPFTMFRTDAYQSIGILRESFGAWETARRHLKAKDGMADQKAVNAAGRRAINSLAGVASAAIMGAAIDVIRNVARGNDDDIWKEMDESKLEPTRTGSTKELLGYNSASSTDSIGLYENLTPEMKAIQEQFERFGYTVFFVDGAMSLENGQRADGLHSNGVISVNVSSNSHGDWMTTLNHELFHAIQNDYEDVVEEVLLLVFENASDEEIVAILTELLEAYKGAGYIEGYLDTMFLEELCCDIFSGIDRGNAGIIKEEWTARVRTYIEQKTGIKAIEHTEKKELDFVKLAGELVKGGVMNIAGGVLFAEEIVSFVDAKKGGDYFFKPEISSVSAIVNLGNTIWKSFESIGKVAAAAKELKKEDKNWIGYLNREADTIHAAVRDVAIDLSNVFGVPIKNMERTIANGLGYLLPEAKVAYQGWYSDLSKGALDGLEGKALEVGMREYLKDELGVLDENVRDEMVRLYGIYGEEILPGANPPKNIMGETEDQDRVASTADQADWEESYRSTMIDGLSGLVASEDYQKLSDEEKKLVIRNMAIYAEGNADDTLGHEDVAQWIKNITTAYQNGAELEDAVLYRAIAETIKADVNERGNAKKGTALIKKIEMLDGIDMTDPQKAAILTAFEEAEGEHLQRAMDAGLSWDEYVQIMSNGAGEPADYTSVTKKGLGHDEALELVRNDTASDFIKLTDEGLSNDVALELVRNNTSSDFIKLTDEGINSDIALELVRNKIKLEPEAGKGKIDDDQIIRAIIGTDLSEEGKYDAIGSILEEGGADYDTMRVVQDTGLSAEQYVNLRAKSNDVQKYMDAVDQGVESNSAYKIVTAVRNMLNNLDKETYQAWEAQSAAVGACDSVEDQIEAYVLYGEDGAEDIDRAKIVEAVTYDITPKMFLDVKRLVIEEYDADGNGKIKMEEVKKALDSMELTDRQKAAIFQMFHMGWKNNPYGDASSIRDAYEAVKK